MKINIALPEALRASLAIYHLISNKREWNNCFTKNNQEILLDLDDFALQEQEEDNLMAPVLGHGIMAHIPWPPSQSNPWNWIIQ